MASTATQFGGEEHFRAPPVRVYALLTTLDAMTATIPDLVSSERVDERTLRCVVRPGFSFLRGTLKLTIGLGDLQPPERAAMNVTAQGIGVSMRIASDLRIEPDADGSKLSWQARFEEIRGLAAALSPGLLKAAADQVVRHAWTAVRKQLGE
jgi:carbon monoxide dehydrogenase subunit G